MGTGASSGCLERYNLQALVVQDKALYKRPDYSLGLIDLSVTGSYSEFPNN